MRGCCTRNGRPLLWSCISFLFAIVCLGLFFVALDANNESLIYLFAIGGLLLFKISVVLCIFWCASADSE